MKENYQIHLPYQFCLKAHSLGGEPQLPNKKIKNPVSLEYVKKSKTDFDFFPDKSSSSPHWLKNKKDKAFYKRPARTCVFCSG